MHRALPGRFVVRMGWTRVRKNSKSRVGDAAGCRMEEAEASRPTTANKCNRIDPSCAMALCAGFDASHVASIRTRAFLRLTFQIDYD